MSRPELTSSIKRDLQIIKQRQALDPKRHYKKEKWQIPKYFQMGTIVEGNTGYYNKLTKNKREQIWLKNCYMMIIQRNILRESIMKFNNRKRVVKESLQKVRSDRKKF